MIYHVLKRLARSWFSLKFRYVRPIVLLDFSSELFKKRVSSELTDLSNGLFSR